MAGANKWKILNISLPPEPYREAEYIISGDVHHLQPLEEYRGIRILSPADFLELMKL